VGASKTGTRLLSIAVNHPTTGRWRPGLLCLQILLAALLLGSWWWPASRPVWDAIDAFAFHALHGTVVSGGDTWRLFWAYTNTRAFDGLSALVFAAIFLDWIRLGGWRHAPVRIAQGVVVAVVTVAVLHVSSNLIFTFERLSPSLVLKPVFLLSEMVDGIKVKDHSGNSFPGDHGTAVVHFAALICVFAGRRHGIAAVGVAAFVVLPRMIGGAHWITDLLVGSLSIALVSTGLLLATPLAAIMVRWVSRPIATAQRWASQRNGLPITVLPPGEA
jgi:membrane-associated phospholipid phosphatase